MKLTIMAMAMAMTSTAWAVEEARLESVYSERIDAMTSAGEAGTMDGVDGVPLAFRIYPGKDARAGILLVPGNTESMLKYAEVIFDLGQAGFNVYVVDHRGMGLSGRLLANPQIVHVKNFDDYAADLEQFVAVVARPREPGPLFVLAHSTGGLIVTELLARRPEWFQAAALSAPLFAVETGVFPPWLARLVISFNVWRGAGEAYAPGYADWNPATADPAASRTSHSLVRSKHQLELYRRVPGIAMSGPSNLWVKTIMTATDRRLEWAKAIRLPIRIWQAETDDFVRGPEQVEFCQATAHCQLVPVAGAFHEMLQEDDAIRTPLIGQIVAFYKSFM